MLRASSGALRLYAISTRPASTATVAVFKDSLSFSTELSLHRQRRARGSTTTGRDVTRESWFNGENGQQPLHYIASVVWTLYSINENTRLRAGTEQQCRDAQQGAPMRQDPLALQL